jgi:ATP-dependent DNA helicase RecG
LETVELLEIVGRGEDSRHQFKADVTNAVSLAAEIVAFSNSDGGMLFIGVADDGTVHGLDTPDRSPPASSS